MTSNQPFRTIVISDLHVSCGPLDDFDSVLESHFISFLKVLEAVAPVELVINGDFLDFVQAPPWKGPELESRAIDGTPLCFSQDQSNQKLQAIYSAHLAMFAALGDFLASDARNRLVILPGNHDADFFWPEIRTDFVGMIIEGRTFSTEQVLFHLESAYRPKSHSDIWIEHGHQFDSVNCFKIKGTEYWSESNPPILADTTGVSRLYECPGTRFMIKYLNRLDEEYPFVDNVKPFSRFLKLFGASAIMRGLGPLKAAVAVWAILRYLAGNSVRHPSDLLGVDKEITPSVSLRLKQAIVKLSSPKQRELVTSLEQQGFAFEGRSPIMILEGGQSSDLMDFLAERPDLLDSMDDFGKGLLGKSGIEGTLTMTRGFVADETQTLAIAARNVIRSGGINGVIMGHTHESVLPTPEIPYFNTGSWTRYYRYSAAEKTHAWETLKPESLADFPYQLGYVEIRPGVAARSLIFRESTKHG